MAVDKLGKLWEIFVLLCAFVATLLESLQL